MNAVLTYKDEKFLDTDFEITIDVSLDSNNGVFRRYHVWNNPVNWIDPEGLKGRGGVGGKGSCVIDKVADVPNFNMGAEWSLTNKCECAQWVCKRCGEVVYAPTGPGPFFTLPGTTCTCIKYHPIGFGQY